MQVTVRCHARPSENVNTLTQIDSFKSTTTRMRTPIGLILVRSKTATIPWHPPHHPPQFPYRYAPLGIRHRYVSLKTIKHYQPTPTLADPLYVITLGLLS